jgi:hypothetical protein
MTNINKVEIIQADTLDIYKWLRKNMDLTIKEASEISKSKIIDFLNNTQKALDFYMYLHIFHGASARLIIDITFKTELPVGTVVYTEEEIIDHDKYSKEIKEQLINEQYINQ